MLKNYATMTLRMLRRQPTHVVLNVLGLAVGMACGILLFLLVQHEWSFDRFHAEAGRIYRVQMDRYQGAERVFKSAVTYPVVGPTMEADFPEVVDHARLIRTSGVLGSGERVFREDAGYYASPGLLRMFSFPVLRGVGAAALDEPNTIVLTERMAHRHFGGADPIGRSLTQDGVRDLTVTAVVADPPPTSHLQFDYLVSFRTFGDGPEAYANTSWGWYDFHTYVQLAPDADAAALQAKLPAFIERYKGEELQASGAREEFLLQPLTAIHFEPDLSWDTAVTRDGTAVAFLGLIAVFVLVIAWVNFVNLATAQAQERAREVGVRKALGAGRGQLVRQFLLEALTINGVAFLVAIALVEAALPAFASVTGAALAFGLRETPGLLLAFAGAFGAGAGLAGFYPAAVLSGFRPVAALKSGRVTAGRGSLRLRQGLVVFQFAATIALIAATLVVVAQLRHMERQDLGIDLAETLVVRGPRVVDDSTYAAAYGAFRQGLLRDPAVRAVTATSAIPGDENYWINLIRTQTMPQEDAQNVYVAAVDAHFFDAFGVELVAGRPFAEASVAEASGEATAAILNVSAARLLGFEAPAAALGAAIPWGPEATFEVVGVIRDFHQGSLRRRVDPTLYVFDEASRGFYALKVGRGEAARARAAAEAAWARHFPGNPFDAFYLDAFFSRQYDGERTFGRLVGAFAGLAILVACLGLFGLVSFTVERRAKEIGVRRVLGASVAGVALLLSKQFLALVALAAVVAGPIAYFAMDAWLSGFAYRIDLGPGLFLLAGLLAVGVAALPLSYRTLHAATTNPARVLRDE